MERLTNEFNNLLERPEPYITIHLVDQSLFHWRGTLNGPEDSPYEGGMFNFEIKFPENFPSSPPTFIFKTKIFHPNIYTDGRVCCEIFNSGWSPRVPVRNVIAYVVGLLNEPSPSTGYSGEARDLCIRDVELYNQRARELTMQYAMG